MLIISLVNVFLKAAYFEQALTYKMNNVECLNALCLCFSQFIV